MPILTQGSSADLVITAKSVLSLSSPSGGFVTIESPTGTVIWAGGESNKQIAVNVGPARITANTRSVFYEVSPFIHDLAHSLSTEATFLDFTTQTGSPVDVMRPIKFGPAATSSTGIVSIDANGIITALKSGPLFAKTRLRATRGGSSGSSLIMFMTEVSVNGGATWSIIGNVGTVSLDVAADTDIFFDMSPIDVDAGLKIRQSFARSSTGTDAGDLTPYTPSPALVSAGVPNAPSAQLTVYRSDAHIYS